MRAQQGPHRIHQHCFLTPKGGGGSLLPLESEFGFSSAYVLFAPRRDCLTETLASRACFQLLPPALRGKARKARSRQLPGV